MIFYWLYRKLRARRAARQAQQADADRASSTGPRHVARPAPATARSTAPRSRPRGLVAMALHQFRYDLRAFFRNVQALFFTLILPVLFLVILATLFGGNGRTTQVSGGRIPVAVYYVPGIIALGVISASFVNLVISVTAQRESGVLKRRRSTPVPAGAIIAGRALTAIVLALGNTAVLLGIGWAAYGARIPARTALALAIAVVIGAAAFCCLGYALAAGIRNADAAQPITQATMLPLYFISGVFVTISSLAPWLRDVANVFPVRHLAGALLTAYSPRTSGSGFAGADLLILAAWGIGGLVIALRAFSWQPLSR